MKKYKIVKCPKKCYKIQVMSGKVLRCKFCNKTTKLKYMNKFGFTMKIYSSFDTGTEASKFIIELKNKVFNESA